MNTEYYSYSIAACRSRMETFLKIPNLIFLIHLTILNFLKEMLALTVTIFTDISYPALWRNH